MAWPATLPKPGTTFSTPGGSPASIASSPRRSAESSVIRRLQHHGSRRPAPGRSSMPIISGSSTDDRAHHTSGSRTVWVSASGRAGTTLPVSCRPSRRSRSACRSPPEGPAAGSPRPACRIQAFQFHQFLAVLADGFREAQEERAAVGRAHGPQTSKARRAEATARSVLGPRLATWAEPAGGGFSVSKVRRTVPGGTGRRSAAGVCRCFRDLAWHSPCYAIWFIFGAGGGFPAASDATCTP